MESRKYLVITFCVIDQFFSKKKKKLSFLDKALLSRGGPVLRLELELGQAFLLLKKYTATKSHDKILPDFHTLAYMEIP